MSGPVFLLIACLCFGGFAIAVATLVRPDPRPDDTLEIL